MSFPQPEDDVFRKALSELSPGQIEEAMSRGIGRNRVRIKNRAKDRKFDTQKTSRQVDQEGVLAEFAHYIWKGLDPYDYARVDPESWDGGVDHYENGKCIQIKGTWWPRVILMADEMVLSRCDYLVKWTVAHLPKARCGGCISVREFRERSDKDDPRARHKKAWTLDESFLHPLAWLHYMTLHGDEWIPWWKEQLKLLDGRQWRLF